MLEAESDLRVVGQGRDGMEVLDIAERRRPDVAILDISMPRRDGIQVCRDIVERRLETSVVLYTGSADPDLLQSGLDAGARGFVLKSGPPQDLVRAVRTVSDGSPYIDATIAASLLSKPPASSGLSGREAEVLQLLANGLTTERVGRTLFLSPATVRSYAENAMHKLEAQNRVHAVAIGLRMGLIT